MQQTWTGAIRMKYTLEERQEIGRRIYEHELTCQQAADEYGIHKHTAKRYLWLYRDTNGLLPQRARISADRIINAKPASSVPEDISDYESMTKEELIREWLLAKINEARAKKGYEVKGVGAEREYIAYDSKSTK